MAFTDLMRLAGGHVEARIVQAAVELTVFDALENSPLTAAEIADRLKFERKATELLLNALVALELLYKRDQIFSLAAVAKKYLVKSSPLYAGGMIRFESSLWNCWEKLPAAIRSGRPVRPADMYQNDPAETETFIDAMDSLVKARGDTEVVAKSLDWSAITELLDVGSGPATYPIALCQRFTELHATVFDLPATLKITERYVREAGVQDRIHLIAGDYRNDPIPRSYDAIFLSNIIHGEGEMENQALMRKLAGNLKPGGRLVVKDHVLDETRSAPPAGAIFSLLMLLTTAGGRCYSFGEIKRWMEGAGLSQVQEIELPPPLTSSLIIGTK